MGINAITAGIWAAGSEVTAAASDPYWSNVVAMLHGDTLTDSSSQALTLTNTGATVNTTTKKYGAGALYFNGSSYLMSTRSSALNLASSDFTIEFWVNPTSLTNSPQPFEWYSSVNIRIPIGINSNGSIWFTILNGVGNQFVQSAAGVIVAGGMVTRCR